MVDIDNEIFRIFEALDSQKQGFIDKDEFFRKLIDFLSQSDEIEEKAVRHMHQLMEPYSRIGLDEFREIYLKLDPSKECGDSLPSPVTTSSRSRSSSSCSDIDEKVERPSRVGATGTSATRLGRELLVASRASLQRMIEGPLVQVELLGPQVVGDMVENTEDNESCLDEGRALQEARELAAELAQERRRYEAECELHRAALTRISKIEHELYDQQALHRSSTEQARQLHLQELTALELARETAEIEADTRYQLLEHKHTALSREHDGLQLRCQELTDKNEGLLRELRYWQSMNRENESILLDYKAVSSRQVTELQTERDRLEMANMELFTALQTAKHLAPSQPSGVTKHYSFVSRVPLSQRPRALSVIEPKPAEPVRLRHYTAESSHKRPESIENEASRLVHLLTMENRNLVERIAHLETVGYYQRQKLDAANCLSLAAEMEQLDLDEMRTALSVERETVRGLQRYMTALTNKLLMAGLIEVFQQES